MTRRFATDFPQARGGRVRRLFRRLGAGARGREVWPVNLEPDCIFCKIIRREIASKIAYEDDDVLAFHDINPQAPTHILIVPKEHIPTLNDLDEGHVSIVGKMFLAAKRLAAEAGISRSGYRCVLNCMAGAGQSVFHIHLHLLGGRTMQWPPG